MERKIDDSIGEHVSEDELAEIHNPHNYVLGDIQYVVKLNKLLKIKEILTKYLVTMNQNALRCVGVSETGIPPQLKQEYAWVMLQLHDCNKVIDSTLVQLENIKQQTAEHKDAGMPISVECDLLAKSLFTASCKKNSLQRQRQEEEQEHRENLGPDEADEEDDAEPASTKNGDSNMVQQPLRPAAANAIYLQIGEVVEKLIQHVAIPDS
ncbi:hypothetical protein CAOG_010230 [Capsaspora owczarzaki ATCC 30864]|uniref:LIN-9 C-terminal domain-containing protein n=1 Tax=Capsaspora owczarzaki (strain ATCC 30864) TaxID=595528 RepID=A0A0D2W220_CAPO3|nr:hypothetical protein CAOG_010230 [Capsaspora owczarzaki ATCC 30864]